MQIIQPSETFSEITSSISTNLWYVAFALVIAAALYFTFRMRGVHLLKIKETLHLFKEDLVEKVGKNTKSVSAFRAFCTTMGNRVGTGNIAGVAIAIVMGGPGAIFWMWIFVLLLTAVSFIENTLGQIYKEKMKDGNIRGGPAYYIKNGLGKPKVAVVISVLIIFLAFSFAGIQINQACASITDAFSMDNSLIVGLILVAAAGIIFFGGVQRVVKISAKIVPFAVVAYLLLVLAVIITNIGEIGGVFESIFSYAFGIREFAGGGLAAMFIWALRRSIFSTDTGVGLIPNISSLAETSHPVKVGLIQSFGTLVDLIICTGSAFVILIYTNKAFPAYNFSEVLTPDQFEAIKGVPLVSDALSSTFLGEAAPFILTILLVIFAFGSIISHYITCETNVRYLTKKPVFIKIMTVILLLSLFTFSQISMQDAWNVADIFEGILCLCNVTVILLLSKYAFQALRDYFRQKREGVKSPVFKAQALSNPGGVTCWGDDASCSEAEEKKNP